MDDKAAVAALAALAQPARLAIFRALIGVGPDGLMPSELCARLAIPPTTLSFHLKTLSQADLIVPERRGRELHYRPALQQMDRLMGYLTDHCCEHLPCAVNAPRQRRC